MVGTINLPNLENDFNYIKNVMPITDNWLQNSINWILLRPKINRVVLLSMPRNMVTLPNQEKQPIEKLSNLSSAPLLPQNLTSFDSEMDSN